MLKWRAGAARRAVVPAEHALVAPRHSPRPTKMTRLTHNCSLGLSGPRFAGGFWRALVAEAATTDRRARAGALAGRRQRPAEPADRIRHGRFPKAAWKEVKSRAVKGLRLALQRLSSILQASER